MLADYIRTQMHNAARDESNGRGNMLPFEPIMLALLRPKWWGREKLIALITAGGQSKVESLGMSLTSRTAVPSSRCEKSELIAEGEARATFSALYPFLLSGIRSVRAHFFQVSLMPMSLVNCGTNGSII